MLNTIVVRTDADSQIGTGHLMRCFSLAQGWQARGGKVVIATNCNNDNLTRHLEAANMPIAAIERPHPNPMDWDRTCEILKSHPDAWVVLDGYHFDAGYQGKIKSCGHRLMAIDDTAHLDKYFADIVLNQNINADRLNYTAEPRTRLLLGLRYVLLRPEFIEQSVTVPKSSKIARKLLVTLGGGDFDNQTLKVIKAIEEVKIDGLEAVIVVGPANPHLKQLQAIIKDSRVPIHLKVNTTHMAELMTWADMAVTAGGSTCWELACMGLPALVIILAENQQAVAKGLEEREAIINLGWHHNLSPVRIAKALENLLLNAARRGKMAEISRKLIDGKGTERVLSELIQQ
jgi:UDP-2,4-diacetamido-2,4,6-trideoxy-beta-L-altropyranose hydrolase